MSLLTVCDAAPATQDGRTGETAIWLDGVSVRYRVPRERIPSFKEFAIRWLRREIAYHDFWALKDVSLEVRRGEVFGIIGHNGAGKSTLLKVIARVLRPTTGRVRVRGRVAPLLELGAGFDSELTGRENVFLNSAILGFSRRDTEARFERIVEFAGIHEFIDMPLRTYSSGMIARLGFAVATDVQPEILIVDEVLAVGDAEFQARSFERIQEFRANGTTILMVSHNLAAVQKMCRHAAWLHHGKVRALGPAEETIRQYQLEAGTA
jgi:ABC-2 type transport system ATP-binding protein/lipopolysaccharide transport system ATP-binding protein